MVFYTEARMDLALEFTALNKVPDIDAKRGVLMERAFYFNCENAVIT